MQNGNDVITLSEIAKRFHCGHEQAYAALNAVGVSVLMEKKNTRGVWRVYNERTINDATPRIQAHLDKRRAASAAVFKKAGKKIPKYGELVTRVDAINTKLDKLLALWEGKP